MRFDEIDQLAVNTVRMLGIDSIEAAKSGHPGIVLGAAPMSYVLWNYYLKVDPNQPNWADRDRFVLSAGHGSAMLYSLLHLSHYEVSLDDLKHFRKLGSKTPGHPEYGVTPGVEATTGPLGQGFGMAVGMAMTEKHLAAQYNRPGLPIVDHYTYVVAGDGDLMEGVSHEAASLAGHLNLNKLVVLYDSNDVVLDGPLGKSFSEDVAARFKAYHWNVLQVADGTDLAEISDALQAAKSNQHGPTLIEVKSTLGYGSPQAGTHKVHGSPLGQQTTATKSALGWEQPAFTVPSVVADRFANEIVARGETAQATWQALFDRYQQQHPVLAQQFQAGLMGQLPANWQMPLQAVPAKGDEATRASSSRVLQAAAQTVPNLWGGSADLSSSNKTFIQGEQWFSNNQPLGRNIAFGIREFAEGTVMNGIALHGGTRIFGSTFLVFADYMKPAIRLATLQKLPVIYIFTHDSIAVGEDGPTHEPIEQVENLRSIPGLTVIRPADLRETKAAWQFALSQTTGPTALILSRQALPQLTVKAPAALQLLDGYIAAPAKQSAALTILATGSEVGLGLQVQAELATQQIDSQVVSVPSYERFNQQREADKQALIGDSSHPRAAIEFGVGNYWHRYVQQPELVFGIDQFGASGSVDEVLRSFEMTPTVIAQQIVAAMG